MTNDKTMVPEFLRPTVELLDRLYHQLRSARPRHYVLALTILVTPICAATLAGPSLAFFGLPGHDAPNNLFLTFTILARWFLVPAVAAVALILGVRQHARHGLSEVEYCLALVLLVLAAPVMLYFTYPAD